MDELLRIVSEKTGLPAEKAKDAVDTVIGYLKDKLPAPVSSQIDNFLGGPGNIAGSAADALKSGIGGMFGTK